MGVAAEDGARTPILPVVSPMRSLLIALIAAVCAMSASAEAQESAPKDMVLLTVSGPIGKTNRGVLDRQEGQPARIAEGRLPKAFAFDRAMLLALEQGTVTAQPPEFDEPVDLQGAAAAGRARSRRGGRR